MTASACGHRRPSRVEVEVPGGATRWQPGARRPGWWRAAAEAPTGTDYAFRVDGGEPLPDPASPRQPYGPAGASRTYDHAAFRGPTASGAARRCQGR